jgi:hypothetical protein
MPAMPYMLRFYLYLLVVSTVAVAPLIGCDQSDRRTRRDRGKDEQVRKERIAEEKAAQRDLILALMKTHGGNDAWEQSLNINTWTADLQERLSGQTIVSAAVLIDVWLGQDNKYQLHLIKEVSLDRKIEFFLSCQKPDTLPQNLTDLPEYVFAAKVHSVRKDQRLAAEILRTGFSNNNGVVFTVRGECVELKLNENRIKRDQESLKPSKEAAERLRGLAK